MIFPQSFISVEGIGTTEVIVMVLNFRAIENRSAHERSIKCEFKNIISRLIDEQENHIFHLEQERVRVEGLSESALGRSTWRQNR